MGRTKEEIMRREFTGHMIDNYTGIENKCIRDAMDEWGKEITIDAFSFLAKHNVICEVTKEGEEVFYYKGELISKEELFQNFL